MEILRSWVLNIATMLVFITAIEMILPDNSIKKYARFILGLILVSVILSPILEILNGADQKLTNQISEFQDVFKSNDNNSEILNDDIKEKKFKENLESNVEKLIKDKYGKVECDAIIDVDVDFKSMKFDIKKIIINLNSGDIKKVEKVEILKQENEKGKNRSSKEEEIRTLLNKELEVPKESIEVYDE